MDQAVGRYPEPWSTDSSPVDARARVHTTQHPVAMEYLGSLRLAPILHARAQLRATLPARARPAGCFCTICTRVDKRLKGHGHNVFPHTLVGP